MKHGKSSTDYKLKPVKPCQCHACQAKRAAQLMYATIYWLAFLSPVIGFIVFSILNHAKHV
jgi:hypothetical protein